MVEVSNAQYGGISEADEREVVDNRWQQAIKSICAGKTTSSKQTWEGGLCWDESQVGKLYQTELKG